MFSEIELFLQTYPEDKNIETASIELVVAVFTAIESVIGFLAKSIREIPLTALSVDCSSAMAAPLTGPVE